MKQLFAILSLLSSLFCKGQIDPQVGDKFIYEVKNGDELYNFTLVVKSLSPEFSFAWQMSNELQSYGKVTVPANALANSNKLYNYFSTGDVKLVGQTSVLLSKATYNQLKTKNAADIYDGKNKMHFTNDGRDGMSYMLNGEYTESASLYLGDPNNHRITVLDNPKFPLILSMEIGFTISIKTYVPVNKASIDLSALIATKMTENTAAGLLSKVDNSSAFMLDDLSHVGTDKRPAVYKTYRAGIEGLVLETLNDSITTVTYYPFEIRHNKDKFYKAHFSIPQITNWTLNRTQQRKVLAKLGQYVSSGTTDAYELKNGKAMYVYYHTPKTTADGLQFNMDEDNASMAGQRVAFVVFER